MGRSMAKCFGDDASNGKRPVTVETRRGAYPRGSLGAGGNISWFPVFKTLALPCYLRMRDFSTRPWNDNAASAIISAGGVVCLV